MSYLRLLIFYISTAFQNLSKKTLPNIHSTYGVNLILADFNNPIFIIQMPTKRRVTNESGKSLLILSSTS